jgi:ferric-dicitrate binding protein FerR (iron transport regulator)
MKSLKEILDNIKNGKGTPDELDDHLKEYWDDVTPSMTPAEVQNTEDNIYRHIRRKGRQAYLWPMSIAASLAIFAVVTFWIFRPDNVEKRFFADGQIYAGRDYVRLEDGTTVLLNTGAEMMVDYRDTARIITLEGEGHFKVTRNARRPFYVKNRRSPLMVKVLGTEFTVTYGPKHEAVYVNEGRVRVTNDELDYGVLTANETLEVNLQTAQVSKMKVFDKAPDWTSEFFIVEDIAMDSVAKLMEDRFRVSIMFKNPAVKRCIVNARFTRNEDLGFVLELLSGAIHITYDFDKTNKIVFIDGPGCD